MGKIVPGLVGLISIPIFLRLFGVTVYGEFALIYSLFLLSITSVTGWLTQGIIRFYNETNNKSFFRKTIFIVTFKLITLSLVLTLPILVYFNYSGIFFIIVVVLSLYLAACFTVSIAIHQAKFEAKKIILADSFRAIFFITTPVVLFFISPLLALFFGVLLSFLAGFIFLNLRNCINIQFKSVLSFPIRTNIDSQNIIKQLWAYGWPLAIWFFLATLLNISDRFIIDYYYGLEKAGEYSAIYDVFSKVFKFLLAPAITAIFPILVKLSDEKKSNDLLKKVIIYELLVFSLLILTLIFFKDFLITDVFKFKNAHDVEPIVIPIFIGSFLWQLSILVHKPLELKKETIKMLWAVLFATIVNLTLNLIFIPIYGYIAAAYTTIMGSVVYIFSISLINYQYYND
ncbi:MAG: oligosaccharide flippase family protein [Chlorobi bacterium]|nr:oligosaccharide flippase family protein [Chlorobiota bacterium]